MINLKKKSIKISNLNDYLLEQIIKNSTDKIIFNVSRFF